MKGGRKIKNEKMGKKKKAGNGRQNAVEANNY